MTPERWQRIKDALHEAMQLEPEPRARYLERLRASEPELCREVESLLAVNDQLRPTFMSEPAAAVLMAQEGPLRDPWIGRRLGPYEIVAEIGAGGMGEVYRAVRADAEYQQNVALKLVRAGQDSNFVLNRLRGERQILAGLEHPNISRLLDGGTTAEGVPYLVMELIEGQPIHEYCAAARLNLDQRLRLFMQVCAAVHYAHQRLVIHRDIKPANILVTAQGVPKLLDFGIAKLLESPDSMSGTATASVVRLFTPTYASPEQFKGETITTASDVYSLGAVLFELLTGRSPDRLRNRRATASLRPSTLLRQVADAESEQPAPIDRALIRGLRGDLDHIVMMATRPEPERRYSSAEQLAADIDRYLQHLPLIARKGTVGYRVSTFVARHKTGVALSAGLVAALLVTAAVAVNEARIAHAQQLQAERRFNDLRRLANSLMRDIYPAVKDLAGSTSARQLIVGRALDYLDGLSHDASGDGTLERELASAYALVGDVQGNPFYANLGDPHGALDSYRKALAIRLQLAAAEPEDATLRRELSGGYNQIGSALTALNNLTGALDNYREAALLLDGVDGHSNDPRVLDQYAGSYYYLANAAMRAGDLHAADDAIRKASLLRDGIVATDPAQRRDVRTHSAGDHGTAASILAAAGDVQGAIEQQQRATDIMAALAREEPDNETLRTFRALAEQGLGGLQERVAQWRDALQSYRAAEPLLQAAATADPHNMFVRAYLMRNLERIGALEVQSGAIDSGLNHITEALALPQAGYAPPTDDPSRAAVEAEGYYDLGRAYERRASESSARRARAQFLLQACDGYRKSIRRWQSVSDKGATDPLAARSGPALAAQHLSHCETQLARVER
jgi:eukaryotic-like serine/threonine-protein kinase